MSLDPYRTHVGPTLAVSKAPAATAAAPDEPRTLQVPLLVAGCVAIVVAACGFALYAWTISSAFGVRG